MSIADRHEQILNILNERSFITVNELAEITFTSPSSIRRDLTYMQNRGLVKRSYGGVTLPEPIKGVASFYDRTHKNVKEKRLIAKKASTLLKDGQSILLDGSSTAAFMLPYISKLNSATLFTNNMSTALSAIEMGIDTHCLGGRSADGSAVLVGTEACKALADINVDIIFFSSQSIDKSGNLTDSSDVENYLRSLMIKAAKTTVFLCDSDKFNKTSLYKLTTLNSVDYAVFDKNFDGLKAKCILI